MKIPKPNVEWHCVVPVPLNDKSYGRLLDDLNWAHQVFAKTVGVTGCCTHVFLSGDTAVLRFWAARRFLKKLARLDNRFVKLGPQAHYDRKPAPPAVIELPGVADKPPAPPTPAETVAANRTPRQQLVQRAIALGILAKGTSVVLERLCVEKEAELKAADPVKISSFAANTQTMGKD